MASVPRTRPEPIPTHWADAMLAAGATFPNTHEPSIRVLSAMSGVTPTLVLRIVHRQFPDRVVPGDIVADLAAALDLDPTVVQTWITTGAPSQPKPSHLRLVQ